MEYKRSVIDITFFSSVFNLNNYVMTLPTL